MGKSGYGELGNWGNEELKNSVNGETRKWQNGARGNVARGKWENGGMGKCRSGEWLNGEKGKWQVGKMGNGKVAKWGNVETASSAIGGTGEWGK